MTPRTLAIDARLERYLLEFGLRETSEQAELREVTDKLAEASMRSSAVQIALLQILLRLAGARSVLEIGTFTGYGTLGFALALPADGAVVTLDYNTAWPDIGRRFWIRAGVAERITTMTGLASEKLADLLAAGREGTFDLVYVDADKKNYGTYFDMALKLVRRGGIIALDNVLWGGAVADESDTERQTEALRRVNARIAGDPDLEFCMLPIGDGLTICRV